MVFASRHRLTPHRARHPNQIRSIEPQNKECFALLAGSESVGPFQVFHLGRALAPGESLFCHPLS